MGYRVGWVSDVRRAACAGVACWAAACGPGTEVADASTAADAAVVQDAAAEPDASASAALLGDTGCPSLAGTFDCPPRGAQPARRITVTESADGDTALYFFDYGDGNPPVPYRASREGILERDFFGQCVEWMGRAALAISFEGGSPTYNFLDESGNYRANLSTLTCTPVE